MKTLSDFKRYLATPKAALRMISLDYYQNNEWVSRPVRNPEWREIGKLQTNAFTLVTPSSKSGASWLYFGKASEWSFDSGSNLIVNLSGGTRLTYVWANVEAAA